MQSILYNGFMLTEPRIDVNTSSQTVLSSHEAGVKSVVYSKEHSIVISASWDSTLHVHRLDSDSTPAVIPLPSKPFSLSLSPTKLVVAMASRALHIYDLKSLALITDQADFQPPSVNKVEIEPWQRRESENGLEGLFGGKTDGAAVGGDDEVVFGMDIDDDDEESDDDDD